MAAPNPTPATERESLTLARRMLAERIRAGSDVAREDWTDAIRWLIGEAESAAALRAELAAAQRTIASLQWPDGGRQPHPLQSCAKCGLGGGLSCFANDCPQVVRAKGADR